jgi:hypothetical protein
MGAESFTRWTCDECGAQHDGKTCAPEWVEHGPVTLCAECQLGPEGEARVLLQRLAAAELDAHKWRSLWRSQRAETDRLTALLADVRREQRERANATRRRAA